MPTYEYRCGTCEKTFEVVQSFHDEPLSSCPTCGSPVRKVFSTPGIVFKGSGFYKTDTRDGKARAGAERSEASSDAASDGKAADKASDGKATEGKASGAPSDAKSGSASDKPTSPGGHSGNGKAPRRPEPARAPGSSASSGGASD